MRPFYAPWFGPTTLKYLFSALQYRDGVHKTAYSDLVVCDLHDVSLVGWNVQAPELSKVDLEEIVVQASIDPGFFLVDLNSWETRASSFELDVLCGYVEEYCVEATVAYRGAFHGRKPLIQLCREAKPGCV